MRSRIFVLVALILSGLVFAYPVTPNLQTRIALAAGQNYSINNWWPLQNSNLSGVQPFKGNVPGLDINSYNMFWQVDGGQLNSMADNQTDYPHKEASVDVSGWNWKGNGPYTINFVAKNSDGSLLAQSSFGVYVTQAPSPTPSPTPILKSVAQPTPTPAPATPPAVAASPFSGAKLYVNPNSEASQWISANQNNPSQVALMQKIASQPEAVWFGNWDSSIQTDVANAVKTIASAGALPVLVAYNIPDRDCGGYSAGGSADANAYEQWIKNFAQGIGGNKTVVILEPDALADMSCLTTADQQIRLTLLKDAVASFKALPKTAVYIDAGHAGWIDTSVMAGWLKQAGISLADGFSLNISNFGYTTDNVSYGSQISGFTGGKHFIIDTSRNGNGPTADNQWCNPSGRALGAAPTTSTGNNLVDAYLWIKPPGESDGTCNGGPSAGVFWPSYALGLAQRASW